MQIDKITRTARGNDRVWQHREGLNPLTRKTNPYGLGHGCRRQPKGISNAMGEVGLIRPFYQ